MIDDELPVADAARLLLESGWDFTDPRKKMRKTPEQVRSFLTELNMNELGYYTEMPDAPRFLLKHVIDCYMLTINAELLPSGRKARREA
jgi:hypothetical protein